MSDGQKKYTMKNLRAIVAAGMSTGEAKSLLEDGYAFEDVLELAKLQGEQRAADNKAAQDAIAKGVQKGERPENDPAPMISNMSYTEGDTAHPRPVLPFELWWNSYPMHMFPETEHWRELELACQLKAGEYTVLRKDGSKMSIDITAVKNADGKVTRLDARFAQTYEDKPKTPPKVVTLYQIIHHGEKHPKQLFVEAMNEYFSLFFKEPVGA